LGTDGAYPSSKVLSFYGRLQTFTPNIRPDLKDMLEANDLAYLAASSEKKVFKYVHLSLMMKNLFCLRL
jgi:hypothetical protein